jgi:hypothetical protein
MDLGEEYWAGSGARLWMRFGRGVEDARRWSTKDFGGFGESAHG